MDYINKWKDYINKSTDYIIFGMVSIFMVVAAGLQAYSAYELGDKCDTKLATASIIAAASLFGSFVFNLVWVCTLYERGAKKWVRSNKKASVTGRVSILLWTAAVVVGTAAAGAALGQAELYKDLSCEVEHSTGLHYASIALLVVSIAWPHAMEKRQDANKFAGVEGKPIQNVQNVQPLRFL